MADRFEIKKLWIDLSVHTSSSGSRTEAHVTEGLDVDWNKATKLAAEGWELVGSVPIMGSSEIPDRVSGLASFQSYTTAYILFFKRRTG